MESGKTWQRETLEPLRIAAEQILESALGDRIKINEIERLTETGRRNLLLRCSIHPVNGLPSSFILKKVETENYSPDDVELWDTRRFFYDWVGTQFLNKISSRFEHSPRFYGGDRDLGLIVLEDVQHCNSLVEPLLGDNPFKGKRALLEYATCLGQLHNDTIGEAAEFDRLYQTISPNMKPARVSINIRNHQYRLEKLGIQLKSNYLHDLETIQETVSNPGAFLTYIHADACPDNVLDPGSQLRLIDQRSQQAPSFHGGVICDFETGFFGHALIDAAGCRMMFPSCWCSKSLPIDLVRQMENTYRTILIQNCPIARDDKIFAKNLVDVCGFWLLDTLSRHFETALEQDRNFGISTTRQRILSRLTAFIIVSQEFTRLPGLRDLSNRLLDLLHQRWSDVPPLPFYPAFSTNRT